MNELSAEYKTAVKLNQKIIFAAQMAQKNLYDMCVMLKEMRDNKLYKELGYQNFEEYCEQEIGFTRRQGQKYSKIGDMYSKENGNSSSHFEKLGVTKLYLLSSLSESQQEEIQQKIDVEDTSVRELKAEITRLKEEKQKADKAAADANKRRVAAESDLLSAKSKNRSLSHELEEAKKNMSPDAKTQDELIRQLDRQLSEADQEHANALERQRKEYQAKINALQEQLNNAASMTEVAVETVMVPATKEIFEAYCNVVENSFGVLLDFVSYNKEYIKSVSQLLDSFDDSLCGIWEENGCLKK